MDPAELPLRDIHLPGQVSWWPPAVGWWILAVLAIVALVALVLFWRRRRQAKPLRQLRRQLLAIEQAYTENKDTQKLSRSLSRFLRQTALQMAPRIDVASVTGERWLQKLDGLLANTEPTLQNDIGRGLLRAPYEPQVNSDGLEMLQVVKTWFNSLSTSGKTPS